MASVPIFLVLTTGIPASLHNRHARILPATVVILPSTNVLVDS